MTATHGQNDTRFDDLCAKARELGVKAGQGKDTLAQFGLLVINAAYDSVIDMVKHKHGDTVDDAVKAYTEYSKAMTSATIFDHKSSSGKVQAAKLRSLVKLGSCTRLGPGEPVSVVNKLMATRDKMRRTPGEAKLLDDAYNTLIRFARFQVKQNTVQDAPTMLRSFCLKGVSPTKTLEDYIEGLCKGLTDLKDGRAQRSTLQHASPHVTSALIALRTDLSDIRAKAREVDTIEDGN